jgi:hypothetical protein
MQALARPTWLRWPALQRPSLPGLVAVALSIVIVSHGVPALGFGLSRLEWLGLFFALAWLLRRPCRWLVRQYFTVWSGVPAHELRRVAAVSVGFAIVLNAASHFRFSAFGDSVWTHGPALRPVLWALQWLADVSLLAAGLSLLLRCIISKCTIHDNTNRLMPVRSIAIAAALAGAGMLATTYCFVRAERTAHYWDYAGYWLASAAWGQQLMAEPGKAGRALADSLGGSDYTLLPALVPGSIMAVAGPGRMPYMLAVAGVYGTALAAAAAWCISTFRTMNGLKTSFAARLSIAFLVATLPLVWEPTFRGHIDLGGTIFCLVAFGLYLRRPPAELRWPQILALGTLFAAALLFRRWYGFWVVSFLMLAFVEQLLLIARRSVVLRRLSLRIRDARPVLFSGGIAILLYVLLAWPAVVRAATINYADDYSGFHSQKSTLDRLGAMADQIGWLYLLAFIVCGCFAIAQPRTRRVGLFAVGLVPLIVLQFLRVQDMNPHHRLLFVPSFLVVVGCAAAALAARTGWLGSIAIIALSGASFTLNYYPPLTTYRSAWIPWTVLAPAYPEVRDDIDELLQLTRDAQRIADERNTSFGVVSSSYDLNQYQILTVHRSLGEPEPQPGRQVLLPEVDKVGGFPGELPGLGVLVVPEREQRTLAAHEQVALQAYGRRVWHGTGLGQAYRALPREYRLRNNLRVRIYIRERALTAAEFADWQNELRAAFPNRPFVTEAQSLPKFETK